MENTEVQGTQLSLAEMRRVMAQAAADLAKMQAAIEVAEANSVANVREAVLANLDSGIVPGVYTVAVGEDGKVAVTRGKAVAARPATPRATTGAAPTSVTHDADPYYTPGLSRGPQATEARRLFYAEGMEPTAIAAQIATSPGAVNRALGPMAEARARRTELTAK